MFFKQRKVKQYSSSEGGYTLLEGLMAVVVVSVLVSAIGPVVAFSVGTRVQAKRVELATQAARTYIDGVKTGAITAPTPSKTAIEEAAVPTDINTFYCVDMDQDSKCTSGSLLDMVVQGIAYHPSSTDPKVGYLLGVRVYRANSFASGVTLKQPSANKPLTADNLTTNALGNRSLPLVVMKTEVAPLDNRFKNIGDRLKLPSPSPSP